MVVHVWVELPFLSVGLHRARTGDRALRAATARELFDLYVLFAGAIIARNEGRSGGDSGPGASGRGRPQVRLLPSGGTASERVCTNRSTGTRRSAFCGGHADFDDSGDAL